MGKLVVVSSQWTPENGDLYLSTSDDGVNWSPRQPLAIDAGEQYYPTIIGTGSDPTQSGQSFYVYYTDSQKGEFDRWGDAQLLRRQVSLDPLTANPGNSMSSLGYTADWQTVGDYQDDFQPGGPAQGWRVCVESEGQARQICGLHFAHLERYRASIQHDGRRYDRTWKESQQRRFSISYSLGGHPGQTKYLPMAGYTIQQIDGAGFYQLSDSSIQKTNSSVTLKKMVCRFSST